MFFYKIDQNKLNLWLNYLLVAYSFLLPINDYARSFLFSMIIILILIRGNYKKYFVPVFTNPVVIAFCLFFLIYFVSLLWSENLKEGIALIKRVKYALFLPLFLSFVDKRFALTIVSGFLGGMFLSEVVSYSAYFRILPSELSWNEIKFYKCYGVDDPSPFLHHSHYGMALALSVAILFYRTVNESLSLKHKTVLAVFMVTMTMNTFVTGGRIGYLLYMILTLMSLFLVFGKRIYKQAVAMVTVFVFIGMISYEFSGIFQKRVDETIHSVKILLTSMDFNSSMGMRAGIWWYSKGVIADNPLLGVGIGDALGEVQKHISFNDKFLKTLVHLHNQYIEVLVATGIIGLLLFLNIFVQIIRFKQDDHELRAIMLLVTAAIGIALLTETFYLKFYLPLWVVFLSAGLANRQTVEDNIVVQTANLRVYFGLILVAFLVGILQ